VRSEFDDVLDGLRDDLARHCSETREVTIDLGPEMTWPIAVMSGDLVDRLAAIAAEAGMPAAMLLRRNANGSHNPDEAMEIADLDQVVAILSAFVCGGV